MAGRDELAKVRLALESGRYLVAIKRSLPSQKETLVGTVDAPNQAIGRMRMDAVLLPVERWYGFPEFGVIWVMSVQCLAWDLAQKSSWV